jgi:hypothetical protein
LGSNSHSLSLLKIRRGFVMDGLLRQADSNSLDLSLCRTRTESRFPLVHQTSKLCFRIFQDNMTMEEGSSSLEKDAIKI